MNDLAVHPVAALFPLLVDVELAELAASIKKSGLDHPIVLDADGRVLDGRNRLAACKMAGVEPRFETYQGGDANDYALRNGIARRHLTTGARAIITAKAARISGVSTRKAGADTDLYQARVAEAGIVLEWAPDRADNVVAGAEPLSKALEIARARKADAERLKVKLAKLGDEAPDLLTLVNEERMSVDDALGALAARVEKARQEAEEARREAAARASEEERRKREQEQVERAHAVRVSDTFRSIVGRILGTYHTDELRADVIKHYADRLGDAMPAEINADTIRAAGDYLHLIADEWKAGRP